MKKIINLLALTIGLSSCEKVIELDLPNAENKLVVEANITNQPGPYFVKLSQSVRFNESSTYPSINNALVVISDNTGVTDTLAHVGNGRYQTKKLKGIEGRTYTLRITAEGKTYTATSTMPQNVRLDNLRINEFRFGNRNNKVIIPSFTDPLTTGNNYHFVLTINGVKDKTYILWNDNTANGQPNERPLRTNDIEIKSGDSAQVEMQCVGLDTYNYLFTLAQIAGNGPGGGTTPTNPPSNISGGALGVFSVHTTQVRNITIQ
jgi:hypothetical protein